MEQFQFCQEVAAQGADYRADADRTEGMHQEFVDTVIKGRLRRIVT